MGIFVYVQTSMEKKNKEQNMSFEKENQGLIGRLTAARSWAIVVDG